MNDMEGIYHLEGTVKNYEWGGFSWLPGLLNLPNEGKKPFAEYWIGTHPSGPSQVLTGEGHKPLSALGGELPFLLKLLDVREMLSIQVHPEAEAAAEAYAREEKEGIPLDDPARFYPDPFGKPELAVALTEFWLLDGFKPAEELHDLLINLPELNELLPLFTGGSYERLYRYVMEMPQQQVDEMLHNLAAKILPMYDQGELKKNSEDYWAARAMKHFVKDAHYDRGIFSIYFFNLLKLERGEGIFQEAGVPHAYLEGRCVEIMGNSDNVLRGGLTHKPVNIPELMKHTRFEAVKPAILFPSADEPGMQFLTPPAPFQLSMLHIPGSAPLSQVALSDEILLLAEGRASVGDLELGSGSLAAWVSSGSNYELHSENGAAIFRATKSP